MVSEAETGKPVSARISLQELVDLWCKHHKTSLNLMQMPPYQKKYHVKIADCKTILGQTAFSIPSSLLIHYTRAAVDIGPINCTKAIFKKWIELWIVSNFRWNRFTFMRQFDIIIIKWGGRKEVQHLEEISVCNSRARSAMINWKDELTYLEVVSGAHWKCSHTWMR